MLQWTTKKTMRNNPVNDITTFLPTVEVKNFENQFIQLLFQNRTKITVRVLDASDKYYL